jgi:ferritin-like metal-binding protein YciE
MPKKIDMSLQDLFVLKLKALYDIETQLIKALPKMAMKSDDEDLRMGFEEHLEQTETHATRLEEAFGILGQKPAKTKVEAIRGLIADTEWIIKNVSGPEARDAALIASAQYVENYELTGYSIASTWATLLGYDDIAELLNATADEERAASEKLTGLAASKINEMAVVDEEQVDDISAEKDSSEQMEDEDM